MRPIDADALREIVEDGLRNNPHKDGYARICHRTEYTHFLDVICRMPTIATLHNDPLTLEELREMDGEPVWVVGLNGYPFRCGLVYWRREGKRNIVYVTINNGVSIDAEKFMAAGGKIYRRKPEEG